MGSVTIVTTMETLSTVTLVYVGIKGVESSVTSVTTIITLSTVTHAFAALIPVTTSVAGVITIMMVSVIPAVVPTTIVGISVTSVTTIMMAGELGQTPKSELEAVIVLIAPQEEEEQSILMLETIHY